MAVLGIMSLAGGSKALVDRMIRRAELRGEERVSRKRGGASGRTAAAATTAMMISL